MKINPHGSQPQLPVSKSDENLARAGQPAINAGELTEAKQAVQTDVKMLSLQYMVDDLKSGSGVREDVVSRAQAKVQTGAYLTRDSAVAAAKGILGL